MYYQPFFEVYDCCKSVSLGEVCTVIFEILKDFIWYCI